MNRFMNWFLKKEIKELKKFNENIGIQEIQINKEIKDNKEIKEIELKKSLKECLSKKYIRLYFGIQNKQYPDKRYYVEKFIYRYSIDPLIDLPIIKIKFVKNKNQYFFKKQDCYRLIKLWYALNKEIEYTLPNQFLLTYIKKICSMDIYDSITDTIFNNNIYKKIDLDDFNNVNTHPEIIAIVKHWDC